MDNKSELVTESTPLIEIENEKYQCWNKFKQSLVLKSVCFGANGLFLAGHMVLNGKYLSYYSGGTGASSLISTYQSLVLGNGIGLILGTGLDFGNAVGQKNYIEAGDIAKTATLLSGGLGIICTGLMFSAKGLSPLVVEKNVADIASDYFLGYAGACPALIFIIVGSQIAFQEGDWYIPPLSTLSVLTISGGLSYLLGYYSNMGALGIGLGGLIGSYSSALGLALWFKRNNYHKYALFTLSINDFKTKLKQLLKSGWVLSLQRLTEWGNLFIITLISGKQSYLQLAALNPSLSALMIIGIAAQGCAASAGMVISKNNGEIMRALKELNYNSLIENHKNNIRTIFKLNLFGILINSAIFTGIYFAREPLTNLLIGDSASDETIVLAETLLWVNMLGMIPDAVRIISSGALRGWKDLLYPTMLSLILMTVIGIPAGFGFGQLTGDPTSMMIYFRCITMLFSAILVFKRCHTLIQKDAAEKIIPHQIEAPAYFRTGLTFFHRGATRNDVISVTINEEEDDKNIDKSFV